MKVAVVTPTIGSPELSQCIQSVDEQTHKNLTHYLFLDGKEHENKIWHQLEGASKIKTIRLEENVGKGWLGHRVYASCSFLVNADVICYLDEDNWIDPDHIEKLVSKIKKGYDWAYSLRKIYDKDGNYLFNDDCESLGKWPIFFNDEAFLIDTSAFAVKQDVAVRVGHAWYDVKRPKAADRQFFHVLKTHYPNYACTGEYTLNYRLGGNENSVSKEFFEEGNKVMKERYPEGFPWLSKPIAQVAPGITIIE
jgi:glycosyltransferase involved in cell wall biosynthesis